MRGNEKAETGGRPERLPTPAVSMNREALCLGSPALSSSAPVFLPRRRFPAVSSAGMTPPKCDGNVAAVESTEATVGSSAPTANRPLRPSDPCLVSAIPFVPMMSLARSRSQTLAVGWSSALFAGNPVPHERRFRAAPPGHERSRSPQCERDLTEYPAGSMTHRTSRDGCATASSSHRSACLAARKARDEKRNVDECPPAGGEPDRHR